MFSHQKWPYKSMASEYLVECVFDYRRASRVLIIYTTRCMICTRYKD